MGEGADLDHGKYMVVWVLEPAGQPLHGRRSTGPHLVAYPSWGGGDQYTALNVLAMEKLSFETEPNSLGRCRHCGSGNLSFIFTSGFVEPMIPGTGVAMRSQGQGVICGDCGCSSTQEFVQTIPRGQ